MRVLKIFVLSKRNKPKLRRSRDGFRIWLLDYKVLKQYVLFECKWFDSSISDTSPFASSPSFFTIFIFFEQGSSSECSFSFSSHFLLFFLSFFALVFSFSAQFSLSLVELVVKVLSSTPFVSSSLFSSVFYKESCFNKS